MPFKIERIVGMEGVTSGGLASVNLDIGPRYHWIKLFVFQNGQPVADLEKVVRWVKLKVNERARRDLSVKRWRSIPIFNKVIPAAHEIPIWMLEPWQTTPADMLNTAWDTFGQRSFELQIQFEELENPADNLRVVAYKAYDNVHVTNADKSLRNRIIEYSTMSVNAPSGWYDVVTLPKNTAINRLHWDGGAIDGLEIIADGFKVFDSDKANNDQMLKDFGMDPTPFKFSLVNDLMGTTEALLATKDLNVRINSPAVNPNATAILETVSFSLN